MYISINMAIELLFVCIVLMGVYELWLVVLKVRDKFRKMFGTGGRR